MNSANFACIGFSEVRAAALRRVAQVLLYKTDVGDVLGTPIETLERHHVLKARKRQTVDDLGVVDQGVDVPPQPAAEDLDRAPSSRTTGSPSGALRTGPNPFVLSQAAPRATTSRSRTSPTRPRTPRGPLPKTA